MLAALLLSTLVRSQDLGDCDALNDTCTTGQTNQLHDEFLKQRIKLQEVIFREYTPAIPPFYTLYSLNNGNESLPSMFTVNIELSMLKLVSVSEPEEKVTVIFDYLMTWQDIRLRWNPAQYGGIEYIYIGLSSIWVPPVATVDAHDVVDYRQGEQKVAFINYNGSVGTYMATVTSVVCAMDIYKFPLDEQTCSVSLMDHLFRNAEYQITTSMTYLPRPLSMLGNGEWEMKRIWRREENITDDDGVFVTNIACLTTR
ncbi:unnamed protein product [Caenorhabditis auriculariae]|uniref:Neurotransmitter-gated ion-channel ligand-binding domain-containing protein n=1 Tax=Caenorhabditis auriculariae TaxID=2777116 RepID=A0A8S1GT46_9PELO|nr:unnamed protein product [Caenorhabditis auriculariae]